MGCVATAVLALSAGTARAVPLAGILVVNTGFDNVSADTKLTLREAMLIANGGTGPTGLNRALTAGEKSQLVGCVFSGGFITSGCGAGVPDSIFFSADVVYVALGQTLPYIQDDGTSIANLTPVVLDMDGNNGPATAVISVFSNSATIANLVIININPGGAGINVLGEGNTIQNTYIGTRPGKTGCGSDNITSRGFRGIAVIHARPVSSAAANYLLGNTIGCMRHDAILVHGSDNTVIGEDANGVARPNRLGVSGDSEYAVPNDGSGVFVTYTYDADLSGYVGSRYTLIANNVIAGNGGSGILLSGTGANTLTSTALNTIRGNRIGVRAIDGSPLGNQRYGILLQDGAYLNRIGGGAAIDRNVISANISDGVRLDNSSFNGVLGNFIGVNISGTESLGNGQNGVTIISSTGNTIGGFNFFGLAVKGNTIGGNMRDGINITDGFANTVVANNIGALGAVALGNGENGVNIASRDTVIGSGTNPAHGNLISRNGQSGVVIVAPASGNFVAANTILSNSVYGVAIWLATHDNVVGAQAAPNDIGWNGFTGVAIYESNDNVIAFNSVHHNSHQGLLFSGSASTGNTLTATKVFSNGKDGIMLTMGLTNNTWSQLSVYGNAGLGIDVNAVSENTDVTDGPLPIITDIRYVGSSTLVAGKAAPSVGGPFPVTVAVEVYDVGDASDPSGYGEGKTYLDIAYVDDAGDWSISLAGHRRCITGFQRRTTSNALVTVTATGEFALNRCVGAWLPLIGR